jgi:glycosyltransferase involved in cell wall biosynthesis
MIQAGERERRRVLLVSGPVAGGMRRHLEALVSGLLPRGYDVAVATPATVELEPLVAWFPFELGERPRPFADTQALRSLRAAVREWRPEVVHAHGVKAALLALALPLPGRPHVLVTFHNLWHGGPLTLPLRWLASRAAAIIVVSEAVGRRLEECGVRHRQLAVVPNGVDLDRFPPSPPRSSDGPFTALFLGRLTEEKGVPVLLEVVQSLPREPLIRVVAAGDGPLRSSLEAAAGQSEGRLSFVGPRQVVTPLYHAADAVVLPSRSEGHPMTALEAMACGLPVVASRVGGLPEIVVDGETGLLVPPGDAPAMVLALVTLASDRERAREMGSAGRARIEALFSEQRMLERVEAVYNRVLGAPCASD